MTALRPDSRHTFDGDGESDPVEVSADLAEMATTHEATATLLASSGQWRQAYEHLRTAIELRHADQLDPVRVPDQLRREVDRLRQEHAEAREQSLRDSLTASYNRRYLDQQLVDLVADRTRRGFGMAVALLDLDWFKSVNDRFGHQEGDRVLQRVAELLSVDLPSGAFCARYGGEEFALVLPGTDADAAVALCEAARARVEAHPWHETTPGLVVTISGGVAHEGPLTAGDDAMHQLRCADVLLYAAKRSGRNAVAYRTGGRVRLAGAAGARRAVAQLPAPALSTPPAPAA